MNINGIYYSILNSGYQAMNSNVPFIRFNCKPDEENGKINIIGCIDNVAKDNLTSEQLDNIAFQVERKFLLSGMKNVNIIFLIYSDNIERDKRFCDGNTKFWIIDTILNRIVVFENQPEEFDGMRSRIEQIMLKESAVNIRKSEKKYVPWITVILMLINIVYFVVLEMLGSTENTLFMLKHGAAYHVNIFKYHEYYRLVTCMFMHFGLAHILNNMLALFLLGSEAEKFYGRTRFLTIYMISGILGSFASSLYYYITSGYVVSAGASGAIYGIIGAMVVKVVEDKRKNMTSFGKIGLVFLLLIMMGRGSGNVDNLAHIGGFAAGMLSGIICYLTIRNKEC